MSSPRAARGPDRVSARRDVRSIFLEELESGAAPANAVFETMADRLAVSERLRDH